MITQVPGLLPAWLKAQNQKWLAGGRPETGIGGGIGDYTDAARLTAQQMVAQEEALLVEAQDREQAAIRTRGFVYAGLSAVAIGALFYAWRKR